MRVVNILNAKGRDVLTVDRGAALTEAVSLLGKNNVGALVVLDSAGGVCGILSERDVVRVMANDGAAAMSAPIADHMSTDVVSCGEDETVDTLMELMTSRRIRHVPVVNDAKLSGIVSIGDVVKRKIQETEQEAEALKSYIAG